MRVLILNPSLFIMGGGEKHMGHFCGYLESAYPDAAIDILVCNHNGPSVPLSDLPGTDELNDRFGLKLERTRIITGSESGHRSLSVYKKTKPGMLAQLAGYLGIRDITREYDLFVNWDYGSRQTGRARYNIYSCMFPPEPYGRPDGLKGFAKRAEDRIFARAGYDLYLCNSAYSRKWLLKYWKRIDPGKATVLYPPCCPDEIRDHDRADKKKKMILSVGRFFATGHNKKQLEMIQCFLAHEKELEGYTYHLAGTVTDRKEDQDYLRRVRELAGRSERIVLHVGISAGELEELYDSSSVFWHATGVDADEDRHPDELEHFGITTVEAMAHGVVPVVTGRGGQREIIDNGTDGYLWDTMEECAAYTVELVHDTGKLEEMSAKAAEKARKFSTERFYENCGEILSWIH